MKSSFPLISFFTFFLLFSFSLKAQFKVEGRLVDAEDKPIFSANVFISSSSDSTKIIDARSTDIDGNFKFQLQKGTYQILVSFLDKSIFKQLIDLYQDKHLGNIKITENAQTNMLKEVLIKETKPRIKLEEGKLIFRPQVVSAGSLIDLIKIAPMLRLNETNIEIIGKGVPQVMVNGKRIRMGGEQLMAYLKTIPADQMEKLEIAQESSAEFDADSKNGYINIVLKKLNTNGVSGSIYTDYSQSKYASGSAGAAVNYFSNKWRISTNIGGNLTNYWIHSMNKIHYSNGLWKDTNEQKLKMNGLNASGAIEYEINKNNIIGVFMNYDLNSQKNKDENSSFVYDQSDMLDSTMRTKGFNPQTFHVLTYNINYTHKFDTLGKKMTFDFDQIINSSNRKQDFSNFVFDEKGELKQPGNRFLSGNDQSMQITTANLGIDLPTRFAKFSFGGKVTFISNDNNTSFYQYVQNDWEAKNNRFDNFRYQENIQAIYLKGIKKMGKWSFTLGIRGENTETKGNSKVYNLATKNSYFKLFPSANVNYQLNDDHTFNLAYNRGITRPGFSWVNPFRWYVNVYEFSHGNPSLQPFFSNSFTFMYVFKQKWTFNMNYNNNKNMYAEVTLLDNQSSLRETIVDNFLDLQSYSLNITTDYTFFNKWEIYPSVFLSHTGLTSHREQVKSVTNLSGGLSVYNQVEILKGQKLLLNSNSVYNLPKVSGTNKYQSFFTQDVGITLQAYKRKLQISLDGTDIFKTGTRRFISNINNIERQGRKYSNSQNFTLTLRYNFKHGKIQNKKTREKTNQEELNRSN
ncbi:outer membrane beta-barrel family protein [Pedobacter sp. FW305-3-2-15-E-R2A2]|uniref:outer membrane beta-barrel family protein n=1 Tax=Pedobacter sp. FW305-3-2-15-E-R2A2 TaxID=3140251 RepID=UPI0031403518